MMACCLSQGCVATAFWPQRQSVSFQITTDSCLARATKRCRFATSLAPSEGRSIMPEFAASSCGRTAMWLLVSPVPPMPSRPIEPSRISCACPVPHFRSPRSRRTLISRSPSQGRSGFEGIQISLHWNCAFTLVVTSRSHMKSLFRDAFAIVLAAWAGLAMAQESWPTKPVKLVVPSSPGGGTDFFARILAKALSDEMHQQFIVENRPGASGNVGAQAVATAPRDGYTFLVTANASIAINPALHMTLAYDAERDLTPVARGVMAVNVLVVNPTAGITDLNDLVAQARKSPETIAFG